MSGVAESSEPPIAILCSGHSVMLDEIMLFPEQEVIKLAVIRAEAAKLMGGVSSGIGFVGSPAWAIGGSVALGLLEGAMSGSMRKQATEKLQVAAAQQARLLAMGRFFQHALIDGIGAPIPQAWCASETVSVTKLRKQREVRANMWARIDLPPEEVTENQTTRYVHFDQEFIAVRNSSGVMFIKWSDVSAYRYQARPGHETDGNKDGAPRYTDAELAAMKRAGQ